MVLLCHVISQGHVLKRSFGFMGRGSSKQITILQSFEAITTLGVAL